MTDFEKVVNALRNEETSGYVEGKHFDVWEWENCGKQIDLRPSSLYDEWIYFKFDSKGNLISIG